MSRSTWIWTSVLLVVANAGGYWFTTLDQQRGPPPQPLAVSNMASLVLVSELDSEQVAAMQRKAVEPSAEPAMDFDAVAALQSESFAGAVSAELMQDAGANELDSSGEVLQEIAVSAVLLGKIIAEAAGSTGTATEVAPVYAAADLEEITVAARYLAVNPVAEPAVEAEVAAEIETVAATTETAAVCWEVGPLNTGQLAQAGALLAAKDITLRQRSEEVTVTTDYWVYLPADNISKFQRLQLNLSARGLESYMINGGPLDGSLSLGLFSQESSAQAVAEPLREEGYPVEIYLRPKETEKRHWLQLADSQYQLLADDFAVAVWAVVDEIPCSPTSGAEP